MAFLLKRLPFAQLSERNFGGIGTSQGGVRKYYYPRVGVALSRVRTDFAKNLSFICIYQNFFVILQRKI